MKLQVKHTFPCGYKIEYMLYTFYGLFGYTKARHTFKCRLHGYSCKTTITPEEITKQEWKNS